MKNIWSKIILLCAVLFSCCISNQAEIIRPIPADEVGQWGYINDHGKMVISPQFNKASDFHNGFAAVMKRDWHTPAGPFLIINKQGTPIANTAFRKFTGFEDGLACVSVYARKLSPGVSNDLSKSVSDEDLKLSGKYTFLTEQGSLWPEFFDQATSFSKGITAVNNDRRWSLIYKSGHVLCKLKTNISQVGFPYVGGHWSYDLIPVSISQLSKFGGPWGFINSHGSMVIEPEFSAVRDFSEGLAAAAVQQGSHRLWGFIDMSGKFVIAPKYFDVGDFSEGLTWVSKNRFDVTFLDKTGKPKFTIKNPRKGFREGFAISGSGESDGFVDRDGKVAIPAQFSYCKNFSNGLAAASIKVGDTYKFGFINKVGKWVIPPTYHYVGSFSDGLAPVCIYDEKLIEQARRDREKEKKMYEDMERAGISD